METPLTDREFSGGGLYTVPMAARLLATKQDKIRSWVEGYGHSKAERILIRQLPRVGGRTVLGFLDFNRERVHPAFHSNWI
jgi:hypothetical protein